MNRTRLTIMNIVENATNSISFLILFSLLTDGIFETGAHGVPSKSQNQLFWVKVVHVM